MKTLRFIGMALLAVVLCVNFAACSDDDEDAALPSSLAGTEWTGTDPYGYVVNVTVGATTCEIDVNKPDGSDYYTRTGSYTYDPSTGSITAEYDGDIIKAQLKGNTITVHYDDYVFTLKKR